MPSVWEFLGRFEFIGNLVNLSVGGISFYYLYSAAIFTGFWVYLVHYLIKVRGAAFKKIFSGPYIYVTLATAAFFFLFGEPNDLRLTYTYEARSFADAAAAVGAKNIAPLLRQDRIAGLIFAVVLYFSNLQVLNLVLCVFLGLFYALWEAILETALGFRRAVALPLVLLAVLLHQKTYYFFSAYSIFALFFSALFLYRLLLLVKDPEKDRSLFRLSQPVFLILLAALFRQESVVLFPVYFTGILFAGRAVFRKALICLFAGAVLYLPFLYHDWTREENQVFSYEWDQAAVERIYDSPARGGADGADMKNSMLINVAMALKNGGRFAHMDRQEFLDSVRAVYFMPHPSVMNIWYNLKYRSPLFTLLTAGWLACFLVCLARLRRLREELKYLAVLSAYIWSLFLIYHLAAMSISIGLSYNYLLPAYIAFCLVAGRDFYSGKAGAA